MADDPFAQTVALFRYGLIAEFLQEPANARGLYARLRHKAAQTYVIPGSARTRVALDTLRHWLKDYRRGGFDALVPKPRADRGRPRALPQPVAEVLLNLKEANRALSIPQLIGMARQSGLAPVGLVIAPSTVHRLFSASGLMAPLPEQPHPADRRKFAFEHAGQLWMSDVMHGPSVGVPGRGRRKTYLIAFLDDATRLVPYGAFALSENTQAFLPIFKQALVRRGIPQRLYVDNGANYRSQQLALVCAKLGVALIHARPYQPQGKGKMERWFRTVRAQFLSTLGDSDTESLEALNRRLWAWVEGEYHQAPHRGLEAHTPLDRWAMSADQVRLPGRDLDLDALFLFEVKRRVQRDRTVSLNGALFEADAALIGQTVRLRFDPSAPASRGVEVWSSQGFEGRALPVDAYANCFVQRDRPGQTISARSTAPAHQASASAPSPHSAQSTPCAPPPRAGLALRDLVNRKPAPQATPTLQDEPHSPASPLPSPRHDD
jgi:putative transposase